MGFTFRGKRYKVINYYRFTLFVLALLLSLTFIGVKGFSLLKDQTGEIMAGEDFEVIEVVIGSGDKAWNIQKELTPNQDPRSMLHMAEYLNGKSLGDIKAGETVLFLMEK